jgi:S-adenosylmethionine:diacylglycerol 3-amino-3-carboxypropyl transferase
MSSNLVKTGFVIEVLRTRDDAECDIVIHSRVDDWVPLSILNRMLRERKKQLSKGGSAWNEIHWVQSMLKNKKGGKS